MKKRDDVKGKKDEQGPVQPMGGFPAFKPGMFLHMTVSWYHAFYKRKFVHLWTQASWRLTLLVFTSEAHSLVVCKEKGAFPRYSDCFKSRHCLSLISQLLTRSVQTVIFARALAISLVWLEERFMFIFTEAASLLCVEGSKFALQHGGIL